jgi:hypothetical protein
MCAALPVAPARRVHPVGRLVDHHNGLLFFLLGLLSRHYLQRWYFDFEMAEFRRKDRNSQMQPLEVRIWRPRRMPADLRIQFLREFLSREER